MIILGNKIGAITSRPLYWGHFLLLSVRQECGKEQQVQKQEVKPVPVPDGEKIVHLRGKGNFIHVFSGQSHY